MHAVTGCLALAALLAGSVSQECKGGGCDANADAESLLHLQMKSARGAQDPDFRMFMKDWHQQQAGELRKLQEDTRTLVNNYKKQGKSRQVARGVQLTNNLGGFIHSVLDCTERCDGPQIATVTSNALSVLNTAGMFIPKVQPALQIFIGFAQMITSLFTRRPGAPAAALPLTFADIRRAVRHEILFQRLQDFKTRANATLNDWYAVKDNLLGPIEQVAWWDWPGQRARSRLADDFRGRLGQFLVDMRSQTQRLNKAWIRSEPGGNPGGVINQVMAENLGTSLPFSGARCTGTCANNGGSWPGACEDGRNVATTQMSSVLGAAEYFLAWMHQLELNVAIVEQMYAQERWREDGILRELRSIVFGNPESAQATGISRHREDILSLQEHCAEVGGRNGMPRALSQTCAMEVGDWRVRSDCDFIEFSVDGRCGGGGWFQIAQPGRTDRSVCRDRQDTVLRNHHSIEVVWNQNCDVPACLRAQACVVSQECINVINGLGARSRSDFFYGSLNPGQRIPRGGTLRSENLEWSLIVQADCNLVLHTQLRVRPVWSSGTSCSRGDRQLYLLIKDENPPRLVLQEEWGDGEIFELWDGERNLFTDNLVGNSSLVLIGRGTSASRHSVRIGLGGRSRTFFVPFNPGETM